MLCTIMGGTMNQNKTWEQKFEKMLAGLNHNNQDLGNEFDLVLPVLFMTMLLS
jgi:hypothetical protein